MDEIRVINIAMLLFFIFGFISWFIHGIFSVFFISLGNEKYISIFDDVFNEKKHFPTLLCFKGNRFRYYCLIYPYFCIFNKTKKLNLKMHIFMSINAYGVWFFLIGIVWIFLFSLQK